MLVWPWIRDEAWNKDKAALRTDPSCLSWVLESAAAAAAEEEAEADGNGTTCLFHWPRNACVSQWIQIQAEVASFLAESTCSFWGMRDTFAHSAALMFQEETLSFPTVNSRNTVTSMWPGEAHGCLGHPGVKGWGPTPGDICSYGQSVIWRHLLAPRQWCCLERLWLTLSLLHRWKLQNTRSAWTDAGSCRRKAAKLGLIVSIYSTSPCYIYTVRSHRD